MSKKEVRTLERIATGIDGLDAVLDGGIPVKSITVVSGHPGSGKTVLTLQLLFAAARKGMKCICFTTLSEPAVKVIRYMQLFEFFDERLVEDQIIFADLGSILRTEGAEAALSELIQRVESEQPAIVMVDSFKAIHDMIDLPRQRSFVYDLAVSMAGWGATTLLVGEYTAAEMATLPEFAIADGILWMGAAREELVMVRQFEVRKFRGSNFTSGIHFFDIEPSGIRFYPRVRGPESVNVQVLPEDRVATGSDGLDALLGGGLPRASSTVVVGGTGTGKTMLGLMFLVEGARRGQPGVLLALEETADQLRATAQGFGWDLEELEERDLLRILYCSPVELSTDRFLHVSRQAIGAIGAQRVVLDSLTSLSLGTVSERRFKELVYALTKHLRADGVTSLMSLEVTEMLGTGQISGHGISFAADNVIFLRYIETMGRLDRALAIIKARGIAHSTELREFRVDSRGPRLGGPIKDLQGVLTGLPFRAKDSPNEPSEPR
jgi:circadian clock protein KaiC